MEQKIIDSIINRIQEINKEEEEKYQIHYLPEEESSEILNNGGKTVPEKSHHTLSNINDLNTNFLKPWGKLNKQNKFNRIMNYVSKIKQKENLDTKQATKLRVLLLKAVNDRLITRKTDVEYCEVNGEILKIQNLKRDPITGEFQIGDTPRLKGVTKFIGNLGNIFNSFPTAKKKSTTNSF